MTKQRALRIKAWLLTLCMVITLIPTTAFAAAGTKTYVSLGDSMSNGYGLTGYGEETSGYGDYGAGAYTELFFDWLKKQDGYADAEHKQMAMSAMRAEDLHFLLTFKGGAAANAALEAQTFDKGLWDAAFTAGDKYTFDTFVNYRFKNIGTTAAIAKEYQDAVAEADLITLAIGNANFGSFLLENITAAFGVFGDGEAADTSWMQNALTGCDPAIQDKLQTLINKLDTSLTASLSSLGNAADPMVDAILYTVVSYLVNYAGVLDAILGLNSDAEVILVGLMDTTAGMTVSFEVEGKKETLALSTVLAALTEPINTYIATLPAVLQASGTYPKTATFYYAESPSVQCLVETFSGDMFEDPANEYIRERFHKEIVGTDKDNLGFIWSMAGEMVNSMGLGMEGINPTLVYVSLDQVKEYEAAIAVSNTAYLQETYITPIMDAVSGSEITDEVKTAAEKAISELLSVVFYLSLEATILEASDPKNGKLDVDALTALASGDIKSVFEPLMDAVENPSEELQAILSKNDQLIYDLIAAVAAEMAKKALDAEVNLTAKNVQDLLSGEEEKINEVFFELAAAMVETMTEEEFEGVGTVDLSQLGIDTDAVREIYNGTEAGYAKLYDMAAKMVSDMESLTVDGIGEIDPSKLDINADVIEAIYKVANGIKIGEDANGEPVDYEAKVNSFYYNMVETLAEDLGYEGLTAEDAKSIMEDESPNAHVFEVAQSTEEVKNYTLSFTVNNKPFSITLEELGLSGGELKTIYDYAKKPTDKDLEAAADEVFYKVATIVANETVFDGVASEKQPDESIIKEIITVEDGDYSLDVFKLAMDLAGDQVVYTIKDAEGNDKNIKLSDLGLSEDGKDLKALYDYARDDENPNNPNKADAYGVYYKLIALVAPEMGFGNLSAEDIESVIDKTKMPTKAVFELALTKAGEEVVYENLKLNELGVDADDLMALYYFAKGEKKVTINETEVDCETAANAALYKIAAVVANNDPEYKDLGLLDTHIKSIVEDTVPSAAVFEVALKIAKDDEVYNKDGVVVKVSELGLTGAELRAVYMDAQDDTTTSILAANAYNKIAAIVANKTTFAGVTDSNGNSLNANDIAKILSGIYETKVFELALKVSGNKEIYRDGDTVVTLGELNLSGDELKALYEYAKTKEETADANAVLYKIAAAVANKTTFANVTGDKLEAGDIVKILNKQYDEKLFNLAIQVADKNKVVYTEGTGEDAVNITLGELGLDGAELKVLYDYASAESKPTEMPDVVENVLYEVAAKVANETTFKDAKNKLKPADIADIITNNYTEGVFDLAIQVVDPDTVVYSEGNANIKLSELELDGADLLALYNYAKAGNPDATTDKVNTILYNIAAKVAKQTAFAGKDVALDGDLVAKIIAGNASGTYDPAVFELAVDVADGNTVVYSDGGKDITLSELGLTGSELQALYNYDKNASDANASAANGVFNKIAAAVANKTVFEGVYDSEGKQLEADDIAKIINKQYDAKLFDLAIQVVDPTTVVYSEGTGDDAVSITLGELNLDGAKLKKLYDYASAESTPEVMPEDVADILYYIAAKVANKTVFNGKGDPVTKDLVGKIDDGKYDASVFDLAFKVVSADTKVYSDVTLGELNLDGAKLKALYDYAKAGDPDATTDEVNAILYDIAAKVANKTVFDGKGDPVTKDIVGKIDDGKYDESVFGLALKVAPATTVVYSDADVTVTLGDLSLDGAELKALYEYDKEPTAANEDAADDVLYKLAAAALTMIYSDDDVTVTISAGDVENIVAGNDDGRKALYRIAAEILGTTSTEIETHVATNPYYASVVESVETTVKEKFQETKGGISSTENNKVVTAVDEQLGKVNTELNNAKGEITGENSMIVTTVDAELNKVKTKLDAAKTEITGDNSAIVTTVDSEFGDVKTKLDNAKTSIGSADNNPVMNAVNTELQSVETKLTTAKGEIAGPNSVIVSTVDNELGQVKTKFNAAKEKIAGDNSEIVTTVDTEFGKVETELNKARNSIIGEDSLVLSAVDEQLGNVKTELDNAKKKFKETIVPDINTELGNVKEKFTNAKNSVGDPNGEFMTKVENEFEAVRADFDKAVYGDANDEGANGKILNAVDENVTEVKNQFTKAKNMISGENSEIVSKVETNLNDVKEKFTSAQTKVSDLVKKGVDGARDKVTTSIDEAKELIAGYDLNSYFELIQKLFAMDELVPEVAKDEATLMSLLHLFSRMLIGNGLGAHPSIAGHAELFDAVKKAYVEKNTVQDELKQDIGLLLGGMAGLMVKFGADILGIALDSDTIKQYIGDLPGAVNALVDVLDRKFADYETSKNTLNNAIAALEKKLNDLTATLEKLSEMLEGKQQELSDAFAKAGNLNDAAADTAIKKLSGVVDELATAIAKTRDAIDETNKLLGKAKEQLKNLNDAMAELESAVVTLKNSTSSMHELVTNVNTSVEAFMQAFDTASDMVLKSINAVKTAYQKSETALESARSYAAEAIDFASSAYDAAYRGLTAAYDALPADMALVLFGAAGAGGFVALTFTKEALISYATDRIVEKQAEREAKVAELQAKIDEKTKTYNELLENSAKKAQLKDEIDAMKVQLQSLKDNIDAEIAELSKGIEEANDGNLTLLKANYQKLVESITSGARSEIKGALDDVLSSAVKTTCDAINSALNAISDALKFVNDKITEVETESKNAYTHATKDDLVIEDDGLYVALGDSVVAADNSYAELLTEAINSEIEANLTLNKLISPNQSISEAVSYINSNSATIAAADLISVGYGNTTFGKLAVDRAVMAMNKESMDDLDWSRIVGSRAAAYVADTLQSIKHSLEMAEVNKLGDGTKDYVGAVVAAVEAYAYYTFEYLVKLPSVIAAIRNHNEDAVIVVVGMYNPLGDLVLTYGEGDEEVTIDMGAYLDELVTAMDVYGTAYAMLALGGAKAIFVNAPNAQTDPVNAENKLSLDQFWVKCESGGLNVLPTAAGQAYIKNELRNALTIYDERTDINEIDGDVTISGTAAYDHTLTASYTGDAAGSVDYQWYRDGVAIEGATEQFYKLTAEDIDKTITVKITGIGAYKGEKAVAEGVEVSKAPGTETPGYKIPEGLTGKYLQSLDDVELPDGWTWVNSEYTDLEALGEQRYEAKFTPGGEYAALYDVVEDVYVIVTVGPGPIPENIYTAPKAKELTANGGTQVLIEAGSIKDGYSDKLTIWYAMGDDAETAPSDGWENYVDNISATAAGTYYVWYKVVGDGTYFEGSTEPVCITVTIAATGAAVTGTVTSFLDESAITIELYDGENLVAAAEIEYTETATNEKLATYTFENVVDGTYTMKVSKANHVTREYEVTVADGVVTITEGGAEATADVKIHPRGDINGDGKVTTADNTIMLRHIKETQLLTDIYMFACANLNGDTYITTADNTLMLRHIKETAMLW